MTFTELLAEAKKLTPPDQIRLATELLQWFNAHWIFPKTQPSSLLLSLPPHPLQNLTTQAYQQKIDETFQNFQNMPQDQELPAIFATIDQERHQDLGRHFPEWES